MRLDCTIEMGAPAGENMARDRAMLQARRPCLRLYTWQPPAITLGCSQAPDILDEDACAREGLAIVPRFTGGAAVLHKDDLTYAFFWPAGVQPALRAVDLRVRFREVFLAAFAELGVQASACDDARWRMPESAICFHGRAAHEILVAGRKVAGNAQRVSRSGVFQHGSIAFRNHEPLFCRLVRGASPSGTMTGLLEHAPDATPDRLAALMARHVARVFDLTIDTSPAVTHNSPLPDEGCTT